jgi:hypothetical protein
MGAMKVVLVKGIAARAHYWRLKYWTARSCFSAARLDANVPRFLRFPVLGFFFREYTR